MHDYHEPVYLISIVAKVLNIHPQTLRQYEKEGLIEPSRTDGKVRLYSQLDIDRIKMILRLTRDLGVNLAGVDVVLQMKQKMDEMQEQIELMEKQLSGSNNTNTIEKSKTLVKKKSNYEIILFDD